VRILVLGGDGYLGWPTALHLSDRDHEVAVLDNFARRSYDDELGVHSLVPIESLHGRAQVWRALSGKQLELFVGNLCDAQFTLDAVRRFRPDAIVHYAEQRAAPYSMIDRQHAVYTQYNNVVGTLNVLFAIAEVGRDIHLVKPGPMGEYGTPNIDIEEGWIDIAHDGRQDRFLFPRQAGSLYHTTKVLDTDLIWFYVRTYGLRVTDLMQGPPLPGLRAEPPRPVLPAPPVPLHRAARALRPGALGGLPPGSVRARGECTPFLPPISPSSASTSHAS